MRAVLSILLLAGLSAVASAAPPAAAAKSPVRIQIESPRPGEPLSNKVDQAPIRGNAMTAGDKPAEFDVMLVIDVSGSTKVASGVDVDRDGEVGFNPQLELLEPGAFPPGTVSTDPSDTILAAELAAADALIASLDESRVRVGIVTFSGDMDPETGLRMRYDQQDAWLDTALTTDFERARASLGAVMARGPHGGTNFAAGLRLAVTELAGLTGAKSRRDPTRRRSCSS
jgi:hypothetical protein